MLYYSPRDERKDEIAYGWYGVSLINPLSDLSIGNYFVNCFKLEKNENSKHRPTIPLKKYGTLHKSPRHFKFHDTAPRNGRGFTRNHPETGIYTRTRAKIPQPRGQKPTQTPLKDLLSVFKPSYREKKPKALRLNGGRARKLST